MLVYFLGSLALASWSIGHEYSHRTLPILLSLPAARSRFLLVKLGVLIPLLVTLGALALTLGLALLLAIGLPMLFAIDGPQLNPVYIGMIVVLATGSLYVSSLCSSGLRTLTVSGPAILLVFLPLGRFIRPFDAVLMSPLDALLLAGLLGLSLRFAFENHRSAERNFRRVGRQVLLMATGLALIARPF